MGLTAVVIAYAIPLLFVILAVVVGLFVSKSEVVGGVTGLSVLVAYYFVLYLMRDRIKKKLVFTLSKIQD
jgi:sigma-E factor negative regulatory protein RseC